MRLLLIWVLWTLFRRAHLLMVTWCFLYVQVYRWSHRICWVCDASIVLTHFSVDCLLLYKSLFSFSFRSFIDVLLVGLTRDEIMERRWKLLVRMWLLNCITWLCLGRIYHWETFTKVYTSWQAGSRELLRLSCRATTRWLPVQWI